MAERYEGADTRAGYRPDSPAAARARTPYAAVDLEGRDYARDEYGLDDWGDYDRNDKLRTGLLAEDGVVILGILLGGAAGYMAASALRQSRRRDDNSRGSINRVASGRFTGRGNGRSSSESVEKDETTDLIASNKVEGTAVYNRQGEKLGEVYNFMVGKRSGRVAYAIMSFGGFLGIGQKYHPVPWNVLTYDTGKKGYVIDANRDRLMKAPSYQAGEEPFAKPDYGRQVRDYWSSGMI